MTSSVFDRDADHPARGSRGYANNPEGITGPKGGDSNNAPPADFLHCQQIYREMMAHAKRTTPDGAGTSTEMVYYEGMLTRLFEELHFTIPYYSTITKHLKNMDCIRQLRRGGGGSPSQWELITEPTIELYMEANSNGKGKSKRRPGVEARANSDMGGEMRDQRIADLNSRVSTLEKTMGQLIRAMQTLEEASK
jgi:hypothetical protein